MFFSLFIFRRLIFVSLFLFVTTFVRFRPLSSPFVIVSVRYRFPVFRSSNEVEQFPVRMRAGDAAHFETKIGIRELLSLLPFLYGKDVFSVRVDKFCFSVLFDDTEIRHARGDFRFRRTVFSQPHDFPARRNKAVILLFFVLFQFLIDIEQIIVDKNFFRVAALFSCAAVAERGTSALSRRGIFPKST